MRWGVTEPLPAERVLEQLALVRRSEGEIIQIVFVGRATPVPKIVGGTPPESVDMFRVFFNLPSDGGNGESAADSGASDWVS